MYGEWMNFTYNNKKKKQMSKEWTNLSY